MKALLCIVIVAVAGTASAASKQAPSCAASYKESLRAVNAEKHWSYFKDTVREVAVQADGSAMVSFFKSSQRFQIGATETALLASAKAALDKKAAVHVAVEESMEELSPDAAGKPSQLRWLDPKEQHPSCR